MKLRVELDWRTTLASVLLVPMLLSLGFWQLDRADEKAELMSRVEERRAEPPITLPMAMRLPANDLADRRLTLTTTFIEDQYVLLDNRLRSGRFGYEVVAFALVGELLVPLNLGWIPGDASRMRIPKPELPVGQHEVQGRIYQPTGKAFMLGDNPFPSPLPGVVQQLTLKDWQGVLDDALSRPVVPFEIRVVSNDPVAFTADWAVVNQTPEKHRGYALQWFTMALALAIAFIFRSSNLAGWVRYRLLGGSS